MKKLLFCVLAFPFLSIACSDDNKEDVLPSLKKVSVEIQRTSTQLALLEDNNMFTVSLDTKYTSSDWSINFDNEGKRLLSKVNKNLTPTSIFKFEQAKVNFQLVNATYIQEVGIEEEDISYAIKFIISVDGKVVKEESVTSFHDAKGHIFQYTE